MINLSIMVHFLTDSACLQRGSRYGKIYGYHTLWYMMKE